MRAYTLIFSSNYKVNITQAQSLKTHLKSAESRARASSLKPDPATEQVTWIAVVLTFPG